MVAKWIGIILLTAAIGIAFGGAVGFLLVSYGRDYILSWYVSGEYGHAISPTDMALGKCSTSGAILGTFAGMVVVLSDAISKSRKTVDTK